MIADLAARLSDPAIRFRLLRFIVVGVGCTLVYLFTGIGLLKLGLAATTAHLIAYPVSLVVSYFAQKRITFRIEGEVRRTAPRFLIATAGIAAVQLALVASLSRIGMDARTTLLLSAGYYPAASFIVHSLFTFRQQPEIRRSARPDA
ncbi:MAG: GtrA family protein [Alphaproteobacteria bacterium]|nr:GtrA family protein [Alphaproteobacteria bacterium]